ncbi:MAG: hypothetical protein MUF72_19275 [Elainella sp. Prado103]|nr:hypothetical protein [Elainella sp. Prado103]
MKMISFTYTTGLAIVLSAVFLPIGGSIGQAQTAIRDLQRNPGVSISGVIHSVVGNEFILDDGTGQIIVDAGPIWYHQLNLRPGEQVTVVGEYDDYDFDAFSITDSSGTVRQIRSPEGPPPWAGGRGRGDRR